MNSEQNIHWPSIIQLAFSILAIFVLWSGAAAMLAAGFAGVLGFSEVVGEALPLFLMAVTMAVTGLLLLPSAYYALMRIMGRPAEPLLVKFNRLRPAFWILLLPAVLGLGYWVLTGTEIPWLLLPPLHILAVGLPVLWLVYVGVNRLPTGSPQRRWGVFGSGLVLGPLLILIAEFAALVLVGILAALTLANQEELIRELTNLAQNLDIENADPEMLLEVFGPYIVQPGVLLAVLSFAAVIVPLIEELLKPVGVWLLAGRALSPAAGFAAGALSGAGYALFESLALTVNGEEWLYLVVARMGTAVIHILTASLVGWALALAWRHGNYVRLGGVYLTAVAIHGLWNALALMTSFADLAGELGQEISPLVVQLGEAAPVGLSALTAAGLVALFFSNRAVSRHEEQSIPL